MTLNVFRNGFTDGIFQFESPGMKKTLKNLRPSGLDDIGAANALYRPGSMKFIDDFIKRKHGEVEIEYLHPDLKSILEPTYGVIVFQEQLISIGRLASLRNPDTLRKATGKKLEGLMKEVGKELREGLYKRGWTKEQVDTLWDIMLDFSRYSFNKAHSYAYAITAYIAAYLKAHHPVEFMCFALNRFKRKQDNRTKVYKKAVLLNEARRMGIEVVPPDFRNPLPDCKVIDGKIHYGLSLISYCNEQIACDLQKLKDRQYDYFVDLLADIEEETSLNSRQVTALINIGFFKEFGGQKSLLKIYKGFKEGGDEEDRELLKKIGKSFSGRLSPKYDKNGKPENKAIKLSILREYEDSVDKNVFNSPHEQYELENELYKFGMSTYPHLPNLIALITKVVGKGNPKITMVELKTGRESTMKMKKKDFLDYNGDPRLVVGDIIKIEDVYQDYKWLPPDENGKFHQSKTDKEWFIRRCTILNYDKLNLK